MKKDNKIELLKLIKSKIIPISLTLSIASSISGCKHKLNKYHEYWLSNTEESKYIMQNIYRNKEIINKYDYIDDRVSYICGTCVIGVGKKINGKMEYGFINQFYKEIIPVGKYTAIDGKAKWISNSIDENVKVNLIRVYNDNLDNDLYGYIDAKTLEEVIPLGNWKKIKVIEKNLINAEKKDGTVEVYNIKKEKNKKLVK